MTYRMTIPGRPVPKARPRVGKSGGRYVIYTPKETKEYEQAVALVAKTACKKPLEGPVAAKFKLYFRKKGKRPDCDNCVKSILDGMNEIAYKDDNQVLHMEVDVYLEGPERAEVEVMPLEAVRKGEGTA